MYFRSVLNGMTLEEKSMKYECPDCGAMPQEMCLGRDARLRSTPHITRIERALSTKPRGPAEQPTQDEKQTKLTPRNKVKLPQWPALNS